MFQEIINHDIKQGCANYTLHKEFQYKFTKHLQKYATELFVYVKLSDLLYIVPQVPSVKAQSCKGPVWGCILLHFTRAPYSGSHYVLQVTACVSHAEGLTSLFFMCHCIVMNGYQIMWKKSECNRWREHFILTAFKTTQNDKNNTET